MKQIDLGPAEYRRGPLRSHPLVHKVFKQAAAAAAVWFMLVVAFGRMFDHQLPWFIIAAPAVAPALLLAFIVIALDDD